MADAQLLAHVRSMVRTVERMDRFAAALPAFKTKAMVAGELRVIDEALDAASGADDAEHFNVWLDAAHASVLRAKRLLSDLEAEIGRGRARVACEERQGGAA